MFTSWIGRLQGHGLWCDDVTFFWKLRLITGLCGKFSPVDVIFAKFESIKEFGRKFSPIIGLREISKNFNLYSWRKSEICKATSWNITKQGASCQDRCGKLRPIIGLRGTWRNSDLYPYGNYEICETPSLKSVLSSPPFFGPKFWRNMNKIWRNKGDTKELGVLCYLQNFIIFLTHFMSVLTLFPSCLSFDDITNRNIWRNSTIDFCLASDEWSECHF